MSWRGGVGWWGEEPSRVGCQASRLREADATTSADFAQFALSRVDLEALRIAGQKVQDVILAAGTTEDELVEDFKKLRRERRMKKR
jgi:hypothetical protein